MYGLCLDVHALLPVCPELDAARRVADVLAHADDIIEEMLGIEVGIVPIRYVHRLDALDAVEGKVVEHQVVGLRSEQEPAVAELLQQVGTEDELLGLPGIERLVHDAERLPVGNVVVQGIQQADALQVRHAVEVDDGLAVVPADGQLVL